MRVGGERAGRGYTVSLTPHVLWKVVEKTAEVL
jgi:hypothetical protein